MKYLLLIALISTSALANDDCLTPTELSGDGTQDHPYQLISGKQLCDITLPSNKHYYPDNTIYAELKFDNIIPNKSVISASLGFNNHSSAELLGKINAWPLPGEIGSGNWDCSGAPGTQHGASFRYCLLFKSQFKQTSGVVKYTIHVNDHQSITGAGILGAIILRNGLNNSNYSN